MAVGYVKRIGTSLCPETTAGPGAGTVCVAEANQNYDYNLVMSRAEAGCEGYIDISTEYGTITFNPKCNVSETATPDYKGYLKTDIIEADCFVGVDSNTVHYNETTLTNTTFPVTFWNNTGDDNGNRCLFGATSNAYGMTFNPANGTFKTNRVNGNHMCTSELQIIHPAGTGLSYWLCSDTRNQNLQLMYGTIDTLAEYVQSSSCFNVCCPVTFCDDICACEYIYATKICTDGEILRVYADCLCMQEGGIDMDDYDICEVGGIYGVGIIDSQDRMLKVCGCGFNICGWGDDGYSCICLNESYACMYSEGGPLTLRAEGNIFLRACGGHIGTYSNVCMWNGCNFYQYNSSGNIVNCMTSAGVFCNSAYVCTNCVYGRTWICTAQAYTTTTWSGLKCVPNMCSIYCYLYCHCMSQAYASGNTLFIRTQSNISGL